MELQSHPERVAAFRRGDRETLAALYRTHLDAVERLFRLGFTFSSKGKTVRFRGYRAPYRLQEAIQEGFMHAFSQRVRERYDSNQPFRPYLMAVLRNHTIDQFRKASTRDKYFVALTDAVADATSENESLERLDPGEAATPETHALAGELQQTLAAFLQELDPEDLSIVEDHLQGPLTQEQMAQKLGESRNDVRKRIRLLRTRLLRHLKRSGLIEKLEVSEVFKIALVLLGAP